MSCSHCNGTGAENGTAYTTCSKCNGSGVVTRVQQTFLGAMQSTTTCPDCGGEGRIITKKMSALWLGKVSYVKKR